MLDGRKEERKEERYEGGNNTYCRFWIRMKERTMLAMDAWRLALGMSLVFLGGGGWW